MTLAKALKAGAALMMWTLVDDAAWVTRCHAAMERALRRAPELGTPLSSRGRSR
jgi:hypothetical protein